MGKYLKDGRKPKRYLGGKAGQAERRAKGKILKAAAVKKFY